MAADDFVVPWIAQLNGDNVEGAKAQFASRLTPRESAKSIRRGAEVPTAANQGWHSQVSTARDSGHNVMSSAAGLSQCQAN